jgi:hypothetical protein
MTRSLASPHGLPAELLLYVFSHRADRSHGFAQSSPRNPELFAPIADFVVLLDVDSLIVLPAGLLQIVCHRYLRIEV